MQDTDTSTNASLAATSAATPVPAPTPLAIALGGGSHTLFALGGALSFPVFSVLSQELAALTEGAGAYDLGYRGQIAIAGEDRLRWLNGMLTNNIQGLSEGAGNDNFVLNAQGRIQGDCQAYRLPTHLLITTDRSQIPTLLAHFDRFIIMDDVATEDISATRTAVGVAGPLAIKLLEALGVTLPEAGSGRWLLETRICGVPVQLMGGAGAAHPAFEIWCANENVPMLWQVLLAAGAVPCGWKAIEALRVLEGVPRYGIDIQDRDLPQETGQMHALHFAKGCYLGQEIVERIRSRGNVHRRLAVVALSTSSSQLPFELTGGEQPAGRITSVAHYQGTHYGLGVIRADAAQRHGTLSFLNGTATLLPHAPLARM